MRSRFSAFVLKNADYLVQTLAPSHREPNEQALVEKSIHSTKWLSLKVIQEDYNPGDTLGYVEFCAFYEATPIGQLHERSAFQKIEGRWYYTTGTLLPNLKFQRNEPCWCGSGKKLKKCHP